MRTQNLAFGRVAPPVAHRAAVARSGPTQARLPELRAISRHDLLRPPAPASFVEIDGAAAPIFVPLARTRAQPNPFKSYLDALARLDVFEEFKQDKGRVAKLQKLEERPAKISADKPKVAILLTKPMQMMPDAQDAKSAAEHVRRQGCEPVFIPPLADVLMPSDRRAVRRLLEEHLRDFDAVIGLGGPDLHPRLYRERNTHSVEVNYPRDRFDLDFLSAALDSECFVLAICRSHQLVNVIRGGKMSQDIQADGLSSLNRNQKDYGLPVGEPFVLKDDAGRVIFEHRVNLVPGSDLARVAGSDRVLTNSYHHQAVTEPGRGLEPNASFVDPSNGRATIEGTEGPNVITVQFHPEGFTKSAPMADLLETAGRRAHVIRLKKNLEKRGKTAPEELLAAMRAMGEGRFLAADYIWAREHLARIARAT
jgi:putative glutamine amidotransferase